MRYCSIHKIEYFADCPECEMDADFADTPHPSAHYETNDNADSRDYTMKQPLDPKW